MELLDNDDHTGRLIATHTRRLRILQEQRAFAGALANPSIIMEIEDIERTIAELRASLARPPAPAALEDLSERAEPPPRQRGLIVLVGPGRAGANPLSQSAGAAIQYHLPEPPGAGLEHCWLIPSGVEELDLAKARRLPEAKQQRDAIDIARELAEICARHGVQARIRPVPEPFKAQPTYDMVRWILAHEAPAAGLAEQELICDFTGGTKLMSAGMILACGERRPMQCMVFGPAGASSPLLVRFEQKT